MSLTSHPREGSPVPDAPANRVATNASALSDTAPRRTLAGLLVRKESWRLSLRGKLLTLTVLVGALWITQDQMYSWLAVSNRVSGEYLIVEGWIHTGGIEQAAAEFKRGRYRAILTSGCIANDGLRAEPTESYADWGAARLRRLGISRELVQSIPCWVERRDRTYHSALAVKEWFQDKHIHVKSIDVVTVGPHARRTRLLFQKALGNEVAVGVIATEDESYDSLHWWRSSEGVREVVGEAIAYLYARLFFYPSTSESGLSDVLQRTTERASRRSREKAPTPAWGREVNVKGSRSQPTPGLCCLMLKNVTTPPIRWRRTGMTEDLGGATATSEEVSLSEMVHSGRFEQL